MVRRRKLYALYHGTGGTITKKVSERKDAICP